MLSDPSVTKTGKRDLDQKAEQGNTSEELSIALKPFQLASVFMSDEQYITISFIPRVVKGLLKFLPVANIPRCGNRAVTIKMEKEDHFLRGDPILCPGSSVHNGVFPHLRMSLKCRAHLKCDGHLCLHHNYTCFTHFCPFA